MYGGIDPKTIPKQKGSTLSQCMMENNCGPHFSAAKGKPHYRYGTIFTINSVVSLVGVKKMLLHF